MSTTTLEIDVPQLCAARLIARPGTLPTVTLPMTGSSVVDVESVWRYLERPAGFFGVRMPRVDDLTAALSAFAATLGAQRLVAASVTIADGEPRVLVTGSTVRPLPSDAVRVCGGLPASPSAAAADPWWRRMAARTTGRGEVDQCERWLNGGGFADGLFAGRPVLGALVFESGGGVVGVEKPEPTSVLDQLAECGALATIDRAVECPTTADRVWWVSPRYETHPVCALDGASLPVDPTAVPSFARWS